MKVVNKYDYIFFQMREKYNEKKTETVEISDEEYERFVEFMNSEEPQVEP